MAVAMEWVSRITVVGGVMVVPGLIGHFADGRLGTRFLAPVGFLLGVCAGMWHLLAVTGVLKPKRPGSGTPSRRTEKDKES
jgi:F0F1-type ATP synthase assembly protein I